MDSGLTLLKMYLKVLLSNIISQEKPAQFNQICLRDTGLSYEKHCKPVCDSRMSCSASCTYCMIRFQL